MQISAPAYSPDRGYREESLPHNRGIALVACQAIWGLTSTKGGHSALLWQEKLAAKPKGSSRGEGKAFINPTSWASREES
jgi:hypothetical protein